MQNVIIYHGSNTAVENPRIWLMDIIKTSDMDFIVPI